MSANKYIMKRIFVLLVSCFISASYSNPIELVVPFTPGGPVDLVARSVQRYLTEQIQTSVIVINKPGADGKIGVAYSMQRPADGHTLVMASTGPFLFNNVVYKSVEHVYTDFDIVAPIAKTPVSIIVSSKSKINSLQDFIASARNEKLNCGVSNSVGAFAARYLIHTYSLDNTVVVPFKGGKDVLVNLLSGHIECAIDAISGYIPSERAGQLKIIIIDDSVGRQFYSWFGVGIPKDTPIANKEQILGKLQQIHLDPEFKKNIETANLEVSASKSPAVTRLFITKEIERYEIMRKQLNIGKIE